MADNAKIRNAESARKSYEARKARQARRLDAREIRDWTRDVFRTADTARPKEPRDTIAGCRAMIIDACRQVGASQEQAITVAERIAGSVPPIVNRHLVAQNDWLREQLAAAQNALIAAEIKTDYHADLAQLREQLEQVIGHNAALLLQLHNRDTAVSVEAV